METADGAAYPENPGNYLITAIMDYYKTPATTITPYNTTHCLECISYAAHCGHMWNTSLALGLHLLQDLIKHFNDYQLLLIWC